MLLTERFVSDCSPLESSPAGTVNVDMSGVADIATFNGSCETGYHDCELVGNWSDTTAVCVPYGKNLILL